MNPTIRYLPIFCLLTLLAACRGTHPPALQFAAADSPGIDYPFTYDDTTGNRYLRELREQYALAEVIAGLDSDRTRALALLDWTHRQWAHNGSNVPSSPDALTILEEARDGKQYRCVEYGIVSTAAMSAVGMPARVLGLKTRDVETAKSGAGHVLAEVWLADEQKWAYVDGQFNVMPVSEGVSLNAVEFQRVLERGGAVQLVNHDGPLEGKEARDYLSFVIPYLYYFDVGFDQRNAPGAPGRIAYEGKGQLMLVPLGAPEPTVFQRSGSLTNLIYTHREAEFYAPPAG